MIIADGRSDKIFLIDVEENNRGGNFRVLSHLEHQPQGNAIVRTEDVVTAIGYWSRWMLDAFFQRLHADGALTPCQKRRATKVAANENCRRARHLIEHTQNKRGIRWRCKFRSSGLCADDGGLGHATSFGARNENKIGAQITRFRGENVSETGLW